MDTNHYTDWYSNKELFEMMETLKGDMVGLSLEMNETKTLIRDYNGLRSNINGINERMFAIEKEVEVNGDNKKEYIGYIIAIISTLFMILNYFR